MTLAAESSAFAKEGERPIALNEFCVCKGALSRMIQFDILLNDSLLHTCRADGVIVATPTGSTAYNLSAGGPVLKPDGNMIAITPVCPHDLFALCSVVEGADRIRIQIGAKDKSDVTLSADGWHAATLRHGDWVEITASGHYVNIIKTSEQSFFDVLRRKLS
jgi:NAD+ kinase